jgi:hypothetical protein
MERSVAKPLLQFTIVIRGLDPGIHCRFEGTSVNDESPKDLVSGLAKRRLFGRRRIVQPGNRPGFDRAIATAVNAG